MVPQSAVISGVGSKLWNFLRIAFFMMRKGILSKRKLIMDLNLMMKREKILEREGKPISEAAVTEMVPQSAVISGVGRKLWNFLRIAFFMMRKGILSKRKLIMDMNLMMKRGKILGKRTFGNLIFHPSKAMAMTPPYGLQDYEFSCSSSPNPFLFNITKRKHRYFPCINGQDDGDDDSDDPRTPVIVLPKIEYSPRYSKELSFDASDIAAGEKLSPLLSPFSVRVSNFSNCDDENASGSHQINAEAEEFIKRFYEQLRLQARTALLQYQEDEYQEMLARGAR